MTIQTAQKKSLGTRDRLIGAMIQSLRTKGFHGVGVNEILNEAVAPKGVLYHHFPGGKAELAIAAIEQVVDHITQRLDFHLNKSSEPVNALTAWMEDAQKALLSSSFEAGCPLATIALESTANNKAIRQAVAKGFDSIRTTLANALLVNGVESSRASNLAALIVSAYEGGLIQARVAENKKPFQDTCEILQDILNLSLPKAQS